MNATDKKMTGKDDQQAQRFAFNDVNHTMGVDGFIVGEVGRKFTQTISTTNIANDTATFNFFQNSTELLYSIRIIYTDGSRTDMLEGERIA